MFKLHELFDDAEQALTIFNSCCGLDHTPVTF